MLEVEQNCEPKCCRQVMPLKEQETVNALSTKLDGSTKPGYYPRTLAYCWARLSTVSGPRKEFFLHISPDIKYDNMKLHFFFKIASQIRGR